ncbi:MAG TPA: 3-dehydroquinate synthase [Clostridiales bacterium]|nr:3-dehydroquinate synthase [Clostridiales bacterium]
MLRTITVDLPGRAYDIHIAPGLLHQAGDRIHAVCPQAALAYVVTDSNVHPLYYPALERSLQQAGLTPVCHVVPAGEASKCPAQLTRLWEGMLSAGLTRSDVVVALGGGVVGDLAGFAAATILRGVDYIQIPTTLLAQVDSSVGGKTAIDLPQGKNLAGAFWQPRLVLMDPDTLHTLPDEVFADGMAEVIKYGCIASEAFFRSLERRPSRQGIMAVIESVLAVCCDLKRELVVQDERDHGLRMLLNFGHTLGHAYELAGRYQTWSHGQAVSAGMVRAAELGVTLGVTPPSIAVRLAELVSAFGLPRSIPCTQEDYAAAIGLDKKGQGARMHLILVDRLGHALAYPMKKAQLLQLL